MTQRECAIVMAYTGVCMLKGDALQVFYDYVAEIMGRPLYTHEIGEQADTIKDAAKDDFMKLCATAEYNYLVDAKRVIPGMTVTDAFDKEYFTIGRNFVVEEWQVRLPRKDDDRYVQEKVRKSYLVRVKDIVSNGTNIQLYVFENDNVRTVEIRASLVIHGYYKFIPVKIIREDDETCT